MKYEGGFQGRTNKLVDGCYSFWCGAIMPIVQALISKNGKKVQVESFEAQIQISSSLNQSAQNHI